MIRKKIIVDTSLTIKADKNALTSIISNIIDNAYKYTPPTGTITITANAKMIRIEDTGKGVSTKDIHHIRDEFWQADDSR